MGTINKSFQMKGYVSKNGYKRIEDVLYECGVLYNAAIQEWDLAWEYNKTRITYQAQAIQFTQIRKEDEFWGDIAYNIGRGVLLFADYARKGYYSRHNSGWENPGKPKTKDPAEYRTINVATPYHGMIRGSKIRIPGMPPIRIRPTQELPHPVNIKTIRITKRGRRITVDLGYEIEETPLPESENTVGVDLGATTKVTLSTGDMFGSAIGDVIASDLGSEEIPISRDMGSLQNEKTRIIRAQQRMTNCKPGSRRWKARRRVLANLHDRERIRRRNENHRITTQIVRNYGLIVIEDINSGELTKSKRGTVDNPGKGVSARQTMNRDIRDRGWSYIQVQLEYKCRWRDRILLKVDPAYTSRQCSVCGYVTGKNSRSHNWSIFRCQSCGQSMNADVNAANNILSKGLEDVGHLSAINIKDIRFMRRVNKADKGELATMYNVSPQAINTILADIQGVK